MANKSLPSAQEHARTLIDQAIADGRIQPDPAAAAQAAGIPTFSAGTAPHDPNTGKPIAPAVPSFEQGQVAIPEEPATPPAPTQGDATRPPAAAAPLAPAVEQPVQPPQAAASTQAAEAAAQAVVDAFADSVELELDEPDFPDVKIPVKVPKQYEAIMKRAFPRRADYDRVKTRWGEAAPVLEPLLKDGRIKNILPLIQMAFADPEYGDYVAKGFQRRQQGLPLVEQALREAAAAGQAPAVQAPPEVSGFDIADPYVAEMVKPVLQQYDQRLRQAEERFQTVEQQQAEARRQQAEYQQQQADMATKMQWAHHDLAQRFPGIFNPALGPNDPAWQKALETTRQYGYQDSYDLRAAIVFGGQTWQNLEAERLAATASPAATVMQQMDARQVELAHQEARRAASLAGGGAPAPTSPAPPPPRPSTKNPDGSMKPSDQYTREMQAWLLQTGQLQAS